jgi:hypothetical protein
MVEIAVAAIPLLLLLAALFLGVYPGLEVAVRLSERIASATLRRGSTERRHAEPRRVPRRNANGGLLLALSLSGRAPPS